MYGGPLSVSFPIVPIGWKRVHALESSQHEIAWPARRAVAGLGRGSSARDPARREAGTDGVFAAAA